MITPLIGDAFGQETVMRESSRLLRSCGHKVHFLGEKIAGEIPESEGVHCIEGLTKLHPLSPPWLVSDTLKRIETYLTQIRPDLIHFIEQLPFKMMKQICATYATVLTSHTVATTCPASHRLILGNSLCQVKSGWACFFHHRKWGCLSHFKNDIRRLHAIHHYQLKRKLLNHFGRIVANSHYIRDVLLLDGVPKSKIELVYNPVSLPSIIPRKGLSKPLIVCGSRLVPIKGIAFLLEALRSLSHKSWTLCIAGDGPLKNELLELSERSAIKERVSFLGSVPRSEWLSILASASIFVQPNVGPESFGMAAAEASLLGVPVVASDIPALNEIVSHEQNGLLVKPGKADEIATAIERLLESNEMRHSLGKTGKRLIEEKFSPAKHLTETLRIYEDVLKNSS